MTGAIGPGVIIVDRLAGLHPVQAAYVTVIAGSILAIGLANYWILTRATTSRIRALLPVHTVSIVWAFVAVLELLVVDPTVGRWLVYLRQGFAYLTPVLFLYFATVYSGRSTSLRNPFNAAYVLVGCLGLLALVTDPWFGLHFEPLVYRTTPFPYYETGVGPVWSITLLWALAGMFVSLYYLVELFFRSRYRSSRALVVYAAGMALSQTPIVLSAMGSVPTLTNYDHSIFSLPIAIVTFFMGARMGMIDIAPITRDELLATTDDVLLVIDDQGLLVDYNRAATALFPEDIAEPVGRELATLVPSVVAQLPQPVTGEAAGTDDPQRQPPTAAGSERGPGDSDTPDTDCTLDVDGTRRHYSVTVSPVTDLGTVHGHTLLMRDVTERHDHQRELRRQNDHLDEFAGSVSHYLRNPLQVADGRTRLARERLSAHIDDPDLRSDALGRLDSLAGALDRMDAIIADLQTLARQGHSVDSTAPVEFAAAVDGAWTHVGTDRATLVCPAAGTIQADRSRLLSVLENLLRNSVDHAGDDVTVTVRLTDDGFVYADDGDGIDPADADHLFEYGYTTSEDGTGLGLSIVKTMVESHGWSIRLDESHDGARFVVTGAVTTVDAGTADVAVQ